MTVRPPIHVPTATGRDALSDLDRVPWSLLAHAYEPGLPDDGLHADVAATLRRLGDDDADALDEAAEALFGNVCHQGTIYEATAYDAPHGSHAGSWGPGVASLTREAFRASERHLMAMASRDVRAATLTAVILSMLRTDPPAAAAVHQLEALLAEWEAASEEEPPTSP